MVEGIQRLDLPQARQAIAPLHTYLRECILDGTLQPGTKLSQVSLADQLGVSRTPVREVLRMLQEEGLVEIEPNQRTRVTGINPSEVDDIYARRILMETLALSMTLPGFGMAELAQGTRLLATMRAASGKGDVAEWFTVHAAFHALFAQAAPQSLRRDLHTLAERTIRYIRIYQLSEPANWQHAGDAEHQNILDALARRDGIAAVSELAQHLSRTALRVLADCTPGYTPLAVPHAVDLVAGKSAMMSQ